MKIIVFANGDNSESVFAKAKAFGPALIVCADGGANNSLTFGIVPDVVIGDLDSLDNTTIEKLEAQGVEMIRYSSDKDETDLELALDYALQRRADSVLVCCAFGGRTDHMLGNILLTSLPKYSGMPITLTDGTTEAVIIRGGDRIKISGAEDLPLSLIPLSPVATGVSLIGAKWILDDESLYLGSTRSLSNVFRSNTAEISLKTGLLLIVTGEAPGVCR